MPTWERKWRYDDFLGDDLRRECAHGNYKNCPECEAGANVYLKAERWATIKESASWFIAGAFFTVAIEGLALFFLR